MAGSPYVIEIKGHRPPSRPLGPVKVWGPGLENGVFPDYQGHFYVDATGAGGGELHVSVMGLKGKKADLVSSHKKYLQYVFLYICIHHFEVCNWRVCINVLDVWHNVVA